MGFQATGTGVFPHREGLLQLPSYCCSCQHRAATMAQPCGRFLHVFSMPIPCQQSQPLPNQGLFYVFGSLYISEMKGDKYLLIPFPKILRNQRIRLLQCYIYIAITIFNCFGVGVACMPGNYYSAAIFKALSQQMRNEHNSALVQENWYIYGQDLEDLFFLSTWAPSSFASILPKSQGNSGRYTELIQCCR